MTQIARDATTGNGGTTVAIDARTATASVGATATTGATQAPRAADAPAEVL